MPDSPIFLEKQSYRRRRLVDAVRLLPLLGLALWMVPLIWPFPTTDGGATAQAGIPMSTALRYLFGVWFGLVLIGLLLWRKTRDAALAPQPPAPLKTETIRAKVPPA